MSINSIMHNNVFFFLNKLYNHDTSLFLKALVLIAIYFLIYNLFFLKK